MSPATVLIVEDHADTREMYAIALSGAGLNTVEAANADNALRRAVALKPAVIVTDLRLGPGLDGLRLCEELKKSPATKNIPVIIVTGSTDDKHLRVKAEALGCIAVWLKPVDPFVLAAEVLKLVDSPKPNE